MNSKASTEVTSRQASPTVKKTRVLNSLSIGHLKYEDYHKLTESWFRWRERFETFSIVADLETLQFASKSILVN